MLDQQAQLVPYAARRRRRTAARTGRQRRPRSAPGCSTTSPPSSPRGTAALAASGEAPLLQIRAVGGAVNDVDPIATAYAHRTQNFCVSAVGRSLPRPEPPAGTRLYPHMHGLYLSFDTDPRPERLHDAFPGATLERLRALKAVYDPDNVFDQNFAIAPATGTSSPRLGLRLGYRRLRTDQGPPPRGPPTRAGLRLLEGLQGIVAELRVLRVDSIGSGDSGPGPDAREPLAVRRYHIPGRPLSAGVTHIPENASW